MRTPAPAILVAAVLALCALQPISAEPSLSDPGLYIGGSLGTAFGPVGRHKRVFGGEGKRDQIFPSPRGSAALAGSVYAGALLHPALAVEAGYLRIRGGPVFSGSPRWHMRRWAASSLYGAVVGRAATGHPLTPFVKLGIHRWLTAAPVVRPATHVPNFERFSSTSWMVGAGADYALTDRLSARAEWKYLPLHGTELRDRSIHVWLAGLNLSF